MDSSFTIKPRPGTSPRAHPLRDPVTVREAVDTELDPNKTVTATADGGTRQNHSPPHQETAARDVVIDPQSQEALFSAIDVRAELTDQSPNQALMRQRAYRQHQPPAEDVTPASDDPHADIEA